MTSPLPDPDCTLPLPGSCQGNSFLDYGQAFCDAGQTYFLCDEATGRYAHYDCSPPGDAWTQVIDTEISAYGRRRRRERPVAILAGVVAATATAPQYVQ